MDDHEVSQILIDLKNQLIQMERIRMYEKLQEISGTYNLPTDATDLMLKLIEDNLITTKEGGSPGKKGGTMFA